MDIYYAALDLGQHRLAAAAKQKANLCEDELMFSGEQFYGLRECGVAFRSRICTVVNIVLS